jgi:hypothetical protein
MLALVISVTYEIDVTGQPRKMGITAGMRNDGTNASANMHAEKEAGSIVLRTVNPGEADSGSMVPKTGSVDTVIRSKSWTR